MADSPASQASERSEVRFRSGDAECAAWLYMPEREEPGPAVVFGHGLGAIREMAMPAYAERLAGAGYPVLAFDYRHFGSSGGEPRQLLDIGRELEDWAAAVEYVRGLPGIDPERVALFGTSFGGGHAIVTASRDPRVAAVIVQCPFTDGLASLRTLPLSSLPKVTLLAVRDLIAALRGAEPVRVALAGPPGSAALMATDDAVPGLHSLVPEGVDFTNAVAARIALRVPFYNPGRAASKVSAPILFCVCDYDSVAPARATLRHAARAPRAEVIRYPIGHFEIYTGESFERAVADQIAFLDRHLA